MQMGKGTQARDATRPTSLGSACVATPPPSALEHIRRPCLKETVSSVSFSPISSDARPWPCPPGGGWRGHTKRVIPLDDPTPEAATLTAHCRNGLSGHRLPAGPSPRSLNSVAVPQNIADGTAVRPASGCIAESMESEVPRSDVATCAHMASLTAAKGGASECPLLDEGTCTTWSGTTSKEGRPAASDMNES